MYWHSLYRHLNNSTTDENTPAFYHNMQLKPNTPLGRRRFFQTMLPDKLRLKSRYSFSRGYCSSKDAREFTHLDKKGKARMVDVSGKTITKRVAVASGQVYLGAKVFEAVRKSEVGKGNALEVARLAGINAAKQTCYLIPLCHNIPLSKVSIDFEMDEQKHCVTVVARVSSMGPTGVEMEALTAVALSALTIYDMCKSISHLIEIGNIKLIKKTGGKSNFLHEEIS